ncbi:ABC transporter permease [Salibacteraceae bacterium]|nr:ABC transporter permease [Salibacteraceae bacterium]MDC1204451.1 ABC transporter permease [Salibacteraceae bacterium]
MNLPFLIARRYFFAKKSHNIINVITGISMLGVGIGAMALVVVLSAFNGLEKLVGSMYSSFQPDIRIELKEGKTFHLDSLPAEQIRAIEGVKFLSPSIEETILLKYKEAQYFVTAKGVTDEFLDMSGLDSMIYDGTLKLKEGNVNFMVLGYGVADQLNVFLNHVFEPIKTYAAKRDATVSTQIHEAFNTDLIYPSAIFSINPEFDYQYVVMPYDYTSKLLQQKDRVSSYEIGIEDDENAEKVAELIQSKIPIQYKVKTRYQLNELLYKTNQTEKWITFFILTFILGIASFNMLGSLTVLILEKKKDLHTLSAMGFTRSAMKKTFQLEGMLISIIGGGGGIAVGLILCLIQQNVGLLKLQEGGVSPYYPIEIQLLDIISVVLIVAVIGFISSWLPTRWLLNKNSQFERN